MVYFGDIIKAIVITAALAAGSAAVAADLASNEELRSMMAADAADRNAEKLDWDKINQHDLARRKRVAEMLAQNQIRTGEDYYNAGMIYQHGGSPEDIRLALAFATISSQLAPEHPAPKWLIAASWDRYLVWKKMPQWYGTQYQAPQDGGPSELYPVDPKAVTDEDRAALNVPSLAKAMEGAGAK
ncbi:hypothetical protein GTP58_18950 [Duganella sp. CY15W]|uniref:hypothetical protein n=1 Tax=Duganella sp. CY15W TaxID=2692172 RepID=UPI001368719A|nr:hypothetical protein [Duganella sp. CY15W]MYM30414.1 hypothetical protein [Duganella sp. CY15W]